MKPNYAKWKRTDLWTLFQAACLAVDVEPPQLGNRNDWFSRIPDKEKRRNAGEIYGHTKNAIRLGKLGAIPQSSFPGPNARVKPGEFIAWLSKRADYTIQEKLKDITPTAPKEELSEKERTTYNNIIGALVQVITGKCSEVNGHPQFPSEAALIETLVEKYPGYQGVKERTLRKKFAEAKRSFTSQN